MAVDLVFTGTLRAHPNVKPILSHSGGTLPYLASRVYGLGVDVASAKLPGVTKDSMYDIPLLLLSILDKTIKQYERLPSLLDRCRHWNIPVRCLLNSV
jgi:hypothetical protein